METVIQSSRICAVVFAVLVLTRAGPAQAETMPRMDWDKPVVCVNLPDGSRTRLQCTEADGDCVCIRSGFHLLDSTGKQRDEWMKDLKGCSADYQSFYLQQLDRSGCKVVPGIAEAPEGYMRDRKGQLYQVAFDMRRRFYLGARWAPLFQRTGYDLGRVGFDFGLRTYGLKYNPRHRHRFRFFQGQVSLMPVDFEVLPMGYDSSRRREKPALWLTNLVGKPGRADINMDLGWGFKLLNTRFHPMGSSLYTELENLFLYGSWELYHNKSMANYVRLTLGPGLGEVLSQADDESTRVAIYPAGSLEGEFTIGKSGLHHLGFNFTGALRFYFDELEKMYYTGRGTLSYEWVLLAINDQPVSLYLEGSAEYRDDIPDAISNVELRGVAGLRFSFWAPALKHRD